MLIRYVGTMLLVVFVLITGNVARANDSGFECTIRAATNDGLIKLLDKRDGYFKECNPIEGNKRPKRITFLSPVSLSLGVCLFDETELNWDKSNGGYRFGDILYQRMALTEEGTCPNLKSEPFVVVPLDLSEEKQAESFSVIVRSFLDVQSGKMKISELLSGVSLFEKIFSAPYADFKSALQESVHGQRNIGRISGYSVFDKADKTYVIYYRLGGRNWHLQGKVENGKLKIVGVSS